MTIANCLTSINNTKQAIAASINAKGGSITSATPFADYATAIDNLPSGGGPEKLFRTWRNLASSSGQTGYTQMEMFRNNSSNYQAYLEKIIETTDFTNPKFSCFCAFWATTARATVSYPTYTLWEIASGFNLDFNNAQLGDCNIFIQMFGANTPETAYRGSISNIDISSATNVTDMFKTGSGITSLSFKGSFGGKNSLSFQPPATLTLDLSPCTLLTDQNIEDIVTGFDRNETNCERIIQLNSTHFNNLSTAAFDQAVALGYKVVSV